MESKKRKIFVVTGATSGIGFATTKQLMEDGAFVIGVGRSEERCRAAKQRLQKICPQGMAEILCADLSLQHEVHNLAERIQETVLAAGFTGLDGLLNNAGVFTWWLAYTAEGQELQWAVNYLAPFLLTRDLLPLLRKAPASRVVTVSSGSHYGAKLNWDDLQLRRSYNGLRAYEHTKMADVLFTHALNIRLGPESTVRAFAADPGLVQTEIGLKGTPGFVKWIWTLRSSGGISAEESARGIVYLLLEPAVHTSSELYWQHGKPKSADRYALDPRNAERLWTASEKMCGITKE